MSDTTTGSEGLPPIEERDRVLGTAAVGDIEEPDKRITAADLEGATVEEVKEALDSGQVTEDQVREAEAQRDKPRETVKNLVGDAGDDS